MKNPAIAPATCNSSNPADYNASNPTACAEKTSAASSQDATASPSEAIKKAIWQPQSWLGQLVCPIPSPNPVTRLRERSRHYYLRRAKGPSAQRFAQAHRGQEDDLHYRIDATRLPRPSGVASLQLCYVNLLAATVLLLIAIGFVIAYTTTPALRANLGSLESLACSIAVVALLYGAVALAHSSYTLAHLHGSARRYADFVAALVDQKGRFVPAEDSDYADYVHAFGEVVIAQREFYDWFTTGNPPTRQVPTYDQIVNF